MPRMIRVLIADDSAFMRRIITDILAEDPQIEVVAVARDGQEALEKARETRPDVITLDIEMPRMDGITVLGIIMKERPVPVVMISTLTREGTEATLRCLELGAIDFIPKPTGLLSPDAARMKEQLVIKVKTAAVARVLASLHMPKAATAVPASPEPSLALRPSMRKGYLRLVVIGTSTGGPRALQEVIPRLPGDLKAAVAVVQHMPAGFTRSLADRLDSLSPLYVKEAEEGDVLEPGKVLLAPGGWHMAVESNQSITLTQGPPLWGVRPSVDVTLQSAAAIFGKRTVGVILTGMGRDGADGMAMIRQYGGATVAEHESTCVVYGMPKSVIDAGSADHIVPLPKIAETIVNVLNEMALAA